MYFVVVAFQLPAREVSLQGWGIRKLRSNKKLAKEYKDGKLTKFDAAEYLDDELQALYLDEVAKENDPSALIKAIDTVARAKGMTKTAKETGIYREGLSKALSQNGNPSFATVYKILNTIGYTLVPTRILKKSEA